MDIESIRKYCLELTHTQEDLKWGSNLCFTIATKIYCVIDTDALYKVAFKCSEEDYAILIEKDSIIPAPYFAKNKWVSILKSNALTAEEWKSYINKSYELVKAKLSKKVQLQLENFNKSNV